MNAYRNSSGLSRRDAGAPLLLLLLGTTAGAGNFAVPYSPTGIACDAVSNVVSVASSGSIYTYGTNGVLQASFSPSGTTFDLGAGTGGNVWVGNSSGVEKFKFNGDGITATFLPSGTVGLGRELVVGGTNWVLVVVGGGEVLAADVGSTNRVGLLPTPAGVTGADWTLRPGGYALDHVVVALNSTTQVLLYDGAGNYLETLNFNQILGQGQDISFGNEEIWVAQGNTAGSTGRAVSYPYTVPAVASASVSVGWTNGAVAVNWSGRWLEWSADGQGWSVVSHAPQPLVLSPTNAQQFFRAVK